MIWKAGNRMMVVCPVCKRVQNMPADTTEAECARCGHTGSDFTRLPINVVKRTSQDA